MKKKFFVFLTTAIEIALVVLGVINTQTNIGLSVVLFALAIIIFAFVVSGYNKMVRIKNKIKESLALIDIQLKMRFDLIPNLVNTVKGYAEHEKSIITEIVKLRKLALETKSEEKKIEYANKIMPNLKNLIAVVENYPELKADAMFKSLMEQLVDIEDRIVAARRIYDRNVNFYNTTIETFPRNFLAFIFDFKRQKLFKIDAGEDVNLQVNFK